MYHKSEEVSGSCRFDAKNRLSSCQRKTIPKMRHEILNEKNHSEVYEDILAFIEKVRCGEYK